jgi:hypothetical protein
MHSHAHTGGTAPRTWLRTVPWRRCLIGAWEGAPRLLAAVVDPLPYVVPVANVGGLKHCAVGAA